jgi:phage gpG-like protein
MLIFKTEGFEELDRKLNELVQDIQSPSEMKAFKKIMSMSVRNALKPLEQDLISRAPYDAETNKSGIHLRETTRIDARIPTEYDRRSAMINESDAYIGTLSVKKSAVSLSQEFGNARTPKHPYLRVTAEQGMKTVENILRTELSERIPAYMKRIINMRAK